MAVVTGASDWSLLEDVWEVIGALLDIVVFRGTAWAWFLSPRVVVVPGLGMGVGFSLCDLVLITVEESDLLLVSEVCESTDNALFDLVVMLEAGLRAWVCSLRPFPLLELL